MATVPVQHKSAGTRMSIHSSRLSAETSSTDSQEKQSDQHTPITAVAHRPRAVLGSLWFRAMICSPVIILIACVLRGVSMHQGMLLRSQPSSHPLKWFDRHIFRSVGPLLPMTSLCLRELLYKFSKLQPWFFPRGGALLLYMQVIMVRMLIYFCHLKVQPLFGGRNLISDHIVLGASIVACLTLEFGCAMADIVSAYCMSDKKHKRLVVLAAALVAGWTALLMYCTSVNMYFTARFYHKEDESVRGLVVGTGFLIPTLMSFTRVRWTRL